MVWLICDFVWEIASRLTFSKFSKFAKLEANTVNVSLVFLLLCKLNFLLSNIP
jgi:hypothetical protein